jgi:ribonucleotide reductase beta subunit family protein with ferritin-like domain
MAATAGPERVENMVKVLRQWQGLERHAMNDMAEIIEQSKNPLVRMIMLIIQHDSLLHHQVQQFLIDSLTEKDVPLSREDVAEIWDKIEEHDKLERKTIELAEQLRNDAWNPIHRQLLDYLLTDEKKHDSLIEQLNEVKRGMNQASGG